MIDLHYNTICDAAVDAEITRIFEDLGLRVAPPIVKPEFGAEAGPGLRWSTVLSRRRGRGTPPSVPDIELIISFFLGSVAHDLGSAAASDLYKGLKVGVAAIIGRVVRLVTVEVVVTDDDVVTYELPPHKRQVDAALSALQDHRKSLRKSKDLRRFVWNNDAAEWQSKPDRSGIKGQKRSNKESG
jgi:hypothetical protein